MSNDELLRQFQSLSPAEQRRLLAQLNAPGGVTAPESEIGGSINTGYQTAGRDLAGRDIVNNVYYGQPTDDPIQALRIYRRTLLDGAAHLPLRGVDVSASDPGREEAALGLTQVYVHLATTTQVAQEEKGRPSDEKTRPLTALEAVAAHQRLVLLGDPGGGKSTFVQHLAHCLAAHALVPEAGWRERLPDWPSDEGDRLPIVVILRDFALGLLPATPAHLWRFIEERLAAQNLGFVAPHLHRALETGQAILLLDGLDELPTLEQRQFARDAVQSFAARYPDNRYLVTCRVLSYVQPIRPDEPYLRLSPRLFPQFALAPFDAERIDRFIHAWYAELARVGSVPADHVAGLSQRLQEAVRRSDLWDLAANPLLLTVTALVHAHKGRLPEARALLYEETVEMLLWRWEEVKIGRGKDAPRLRQLLLDIGRSDLDLKRLLWRLAYEAHESGGSQKETADIAELDLRRELAALCPQEDWNWADQALQAIKLRAGLLVERRPGVFSFPHRTFQEYLAGARLATQSGFAEQAARLAAQGAFWREVILLAAGRLVYLSGELDRPLALVQRLLLGGDDDLGWRQVWLAGDILREAGQRRISEDPLGLALLNQTRTRLTELVAGGRLHQRERAAAGETLAELGDRRPGVGTRQLENARQPEGATLPDILLSYIPPGPFWMGAAEDEREAQDRERPLHSVDIAYGYWLARYPVTVAQFAAFTAASGHRPDSGDRWRGVANQPVVNVSWDDALAFCRWLDEQWRGQGWLPPGYSLALPSEAEWEKGARGGRQIPATPLLHPPGPDLAAALSQPAALSANPHPLRRYLWGKDWMAERANSKEGELQKACAVGAYPDGASPYGLLDMSGNVWEWTRSRWGKDFMKPDFNYLYAAEDGREDMQSRDLRVLRGGSWYSSKVALRCAARYGLYPHNRYVHLGFRVCASPFSIP